MKKADVKQYLKTFGTLREVAIKLGYSEESDLADKAKRADNVFHGWPAELKPTQLSNLKRRMKAAKMKIPKEWQA
jgi:hypothetical protein